MKSHGFPKIYAVGSTEVQDVFDGVVEITEKVDGSCIGFGKIDGEDKYGIWYYEIDPAVIPGDILLVETEQGPKEICVEKIAYLAGPHYCSVHQHVLEHRCNAEQVGA